MNDNFYMMNRQKLLFMVQELHLRGYEKLRVIPSLAPSGLYWRCSFVDETKMNSIIASNWIIIQENENSKEEILLTTKELADLFVKDNIEFMANCKGLNEEYVKWYGEMLEQLNRDELPYAFADWDLPKGVWKTSKGNEIKTLPNEEIYYDI